VNCEQHINYTDKHHPAPKQLSPKLPYPVQPCNLAQGNTFDRRWWSSPQPFTGSANDTCSSKCGFYMIIVLQNVHFIYTKLYIMSCISCPLSPRNSRALSSCVIRCDCEHSVGSIRNPKQRRIHNILQFCFFFFSLFFNDGFENEVWFSLKWSEHLLVERAIYFIHFLPVFFYFPPKKKKTLGRGDDAKEVPIPTCSHAKVVKRRGNNSSSSSFFLRLLFVKVYPRGREEEENYQWVGKWMNPCI